MLSNLNDPRVLIKQMTARTISNETKQLGNGMFCKVVSIPSNVCV